MKLNEVKDYTLGVLRGTFKNKNVLDKISAEGKNLRFDGKNLGDSYLFEGVENYSEDEIIVGRWTDGKPIYRKVKYVELSSESAQVGIDMAISDIDIVINSFGYLINNYNNENQIIPTGFRTADNSLFFTSSFSALKSSFSYIRADKNHWISNTSKKSMVVAIVEYTKTTDAPGSSSDLINAPTNFVDGGVHSENEVIIGQWIDGKPLYRVTLKLKAPSTTNTWTNIKTIDDLDELVTLKGIVLNTAENFKTTIPYGWDTSNNILFGCRGNNIQLYVASGGGFRNGDCNVVIEYTKTTDEPQDMSITSTLTTVASDEEVAEVFK